MADITTAAEMARNRGMNGKSYRARLRRNLAGQHTFGTWAVEVGSDKHRLMQRELEDMIAESKNA
jgi:hypothetical protein